MTLVLFAVIIYPVLHFLQKWKGYAHLFAQKEPGEVKKSLMILFLTDAALVAVCWGIFDLPYIAVTAILMWGTGDGTAALVGNRFGKHHVVLKFADPKKTWEGSLGMVVVSVIVGIAAMMIQTTIAWYHCLIIAGVTAVFGAYTELVSHHGNDTANVPVVNSAVMLILHFILRASL